MAVRLRQDEGGRRVETNYEVERRIPPAAFARITTLPANTITFTNSFLTDNTTYEYRVRAIAGANTSGYSNIVSATP